MTVFKFKIWHLNAKGEIDDHDERQERLVLAETEEEAEKKLDEYRKKMVSNGYADFIYLNNPTVECDFVIV